VSLEVGWQTQSLASVGKVLRDHSFWRDYLRGGMNLKRSAGTDFSVHLAVFNEPYLGFLLEGRKTVESRFSINRCAPYRQVSKGDVLFLKSAGGPIVGVCLVDHVWFYDLDPTSWKDVKRYASALCAHDPTFWSSRERANFATLMRVTRPTMISAVDCDKRDRRGWVVLDRADSQCNLAL
jgi:hypothetical protein